MRGTGENEAVLSKENQDDTTEAQPEVPHAVVTRDCAKSPVAGVTSRCRWQRRLGSAPHGRVTGGHAAPPGEQPMA